MTNNQAIKKYEKKEVSLEDFLEAIAENGNCPAIINDDNGHWAVSETGVQNVSFGDDPQDLSSSFFIEAADLKKSVREAVLHFYKDTDG